MSVLWAFSFALSILLWALGFVIELPDSLHFAALLPPGFTGMVLAMTCLSQFIISVLIDRRYEPKLAFSLVWVIWYPLVYWMLSLFTTVVSFVKVMALGKKGRARWTSSDRGVTSARAAS